MNAFKFALALIFITFNSLHASDGNESGNGGGGVADGSRYMTFYSAGVFVDSAELSIDEVPNLREISDLFMTLPSLNATYSSTYFKALIPSQQRKYYKVTENKFTPEVRAKLLSEYSRITGLDVSKLVLFAITDINSKTTYLLPEFYSLKKSSEQMAILYHESFWLVRKPASYEEVVRSEILFQKYIENQNSPIALMDWLETILPSGAYVNAGYGIDNQTGALAVLAKEKITLGDLLGTEPFRDDGEFFGSQDQDLALQHLFSLQQRAPKSMLIRALIRKISANLRIIFSAGPKGNPPACWMHPYTKIAVHDGVLFRCPDSGFDILLKFGIEFN